jgi:hypothetical protein
LVLAQKGAHNSFADLENLTDEELEEMHADMCKRAEHTLATLEGRRGAKGNHKKKTRRARNK